jgi:hypothetical protein
MEFLNDYVVLVILGICYCIGFILKHAVHSKTLDRFIPLIMGALGIFLNVWASGWAITPAIILGGLASGLAATGTNQIFKQLTKDSEDLEN